MFTESELQSIYTYENLSLAEKMYQEMSDKHKCCIDALRMTRLVIVESNCHDKGFNEANLIIMLEAKGVDQLSLKVCQNLFQNFFELGHAICFEDIEKVELHLLRKQFREKYSIPLKNSRN